MDVKRAIAELTSQVSEIYYDSDEEDLLKDSNTLDDNHDPAEDSYEIGSSKLRKITDSPKFSEHVYGGKKTTREKTYSLSESSNNDILESASFDESSDNATGSVDDEDSDENESEDNSTFPGNNKTVSLQKRKSSRNEVLDFNIYSAGSKNISSDIRKGNAIRNQLRLWENLLECRIKVQNGLVACNNLPPSNSLLEAKIELNSEDQLKLNKCKKNLLILLGKMVDLQTNLMEQCCEFRVQKDNNNGDLDEEIKSDLSEIDEVVEEKEDQPEIKKRKLNDYSSLIRNNHSKFALFRNAAIQKWNDKTKISTGKIANSNFSAFDQSTLKQIEQIMTEKSRLINRTRIKRSDNRKVDSKNQENLTQNSKENILSAEIFDDTDFYHKLLRDYIERKSVDATNSSHTERQMIELQKLRSKMKKNVDTKSTKGRKLRFVVIPKLVNFMAPHPYNSWSQQAEAELFSSLFGNIKVTN